ncbi:MAG: FAD-binding protein [Candidatus Roizmanbacteria bacterium]
MSTIIKHEHPIGDKFTWKVECTARYFACANTIEELKSILLSKEFTSCTKRYVLGLGANTLFSSSYYDGFVLQIDLKGLHLVGETDSTMIFEVAAGENWHEMIRKFVNEYGLGGMENLAYIPGTFGAAAIQNVAAYGQTFEDVFVELRAIDIVTLESRTFSKLEGAFHYRQSYFKSRDFRDRYIILSTTVSLKKPSKHQAEFSYHSNYESLKQELPTDGPYTSRHIFDAVTSLRKKKLPEVTTVGTNGSTFMNPIISGEKVKELLLKFPRLQYYHVEKMQYADTATIPLHDGSMYKIAAGHIFDQLGWRGKVIDGVGTWKNHALVVCNYTASTPKPILDYIKAMQSDFLIATGIMIEPEINIVN